MNPSQPRPHTHQSRKTNYTNIYLQTLVSSNRFSFIYIYIYSAPQGIDPYREEH